MKISAVEVAPPLTRLGALRPGDVFSIHGCERYAIVARNENEENPIRPGIRIVFLDDGETERWTNDSMVVHHPRAELNPGLPG